MEQPPRRYAIPMTQSVAHVARDAYISYANIQGKVQDFPKGKVFVLRSGSKLIPASRQARDLADGATYELSVEDEA
jgi:hypothetical protein